MILTEEHRISRSRHKELFRMMDRYCYLAKNLSNSVNYLLKQCYRIHRKLAQGEILDSWEKGMIYRANCAYEDMGGVPLHALCHMQPDLHPGEMQGMEVLFQGAAGIPQGPARLLRPPKGAGIPGPCPRPGEDRHHEPELLGR